MLTFACASAILTVMRRFALIAALLLASWSQAVHCLASEKASVSEASCHEESAPKPDSSPVSDCAVMACCQAVLLNPVVAAPAPDAAKFILAAASGPALVAPQSASVVSVNAPSTPPGARLSVSRLGRAPPRA